MSVGIILATAASYFFNIYYFLIIAAVVFSWVRPMRGTFLFDLARVTYQLTEPLLSPIRRALPLAGGFDFSPIIALLLLQLVQRLVVGLLYQIPV